MNIAPPGTESQAVRAASSAFRAQHVGDVEERERFGGLARGHDDIACRVDIDPFGAAFLRMGDPQGQSEARGGEITDLATDRATCRGDRDTALRMKRVEGAQLPGGHRGVEASTETPPC